MKLTGKIEPQHWNRLWAIPVLCGIFICAWVLDRHSIEILSYWTGIPKAEIGDRGAEPARLMAIGLYKITFAIPVCALLAWVTATMARKEGTNGWSRWTIFFALYMYCFSQLAAR